MLSWLKTNKVNVSKLKIMYQDEGHREMCAAKNIKKGETVLTIPDNLILKFNDVVKSS